MFLKWVTLLNIVFFIKCESNNENFLFIKQDYYFKKTESCVKHMNILEFKQKLDHFDSKSNTTWSMKALYNGNFYKLEGPIFIMIGGENPFDFDWLNKGLMFDLAKTHNAFMFYTIHRFYGESNTTSNLSVENLKYLTPDQALADIIHLIRTLKTSNENFNESKVVVFGGSYPGNLALWIRQKYPKDIHAAVVSGAPVSAKFSFDEYYNEVERILGETCSSIIVNTLQEIISYLGTPEGSIKIQQDFNLCQPLNGSDPLEIMYLFSIILTYFGNLVQNNGQSKINSTCQEINNFDSKSDYKKLFNFLNKTLGTKCKKNYKDMKKYISTTNTGNLRQWMYQSCTQFGFFQTISHKQKLLPEEMYQTWCQDFFGPTFNLREAQLGITRTNLVYGGVNPDVSRVVAIYGTNDPWRKLGLNESSDPNFPVIYINGAYHCEDLKPTSDLSSKELIKAQLQVKNYIRKWLEKD